MYASGYHFCLVIALLACYLGQLHGYVFKSRYVDRCSSKPLPLTTASWMPLKACSPPRNACSEPKSPVDRKQLMLSSSLSYASRMVAACALALPAVVRAEQGSIKASSLADAQAAVKQVKACIDGLNEMETAAKTGDFATVAKILSREQYQTFEKAVTTIVRSDKISAEDKVTLGTIKRYGVVADAIIMLGGLGGELKAGGFSVGGGGVSSSANGIEDDEDADESDGSAQVNGDEVRKYIRLSRESLLDVYRICSPILSL